MKDKADKESKAAEKTEKKQKQQVGEMSFLEHLEELRWHIIRSFLAIFIFSVVGFIFQDFIFEEIIFKPKSPDFFTNRMFARLGDWIGSESVKINQQELQLININLAGQFTMSMWTALVAGLIVGSPVIFNEFWKFIKPALYEHERQVASGAVIYTTFLFILGLMFGYYLIVPLSTQFFSTYSISKEVLNQINITSYISMVVSVVFASGVIFLLPVFSYSLSKVGILTPTFMRKYRKHAIVVMFLLSAIITPPDIFSQVLVAIPLLTLYEVSIFISARVEKNRIKKELARA